MTQPHIDHRQTIASLLARCPPLPDRLIPDNTYIRPCLRASWLSDQPHWVPILGSIHTDPEHVRADFRHAHVDYRFLTLPAKRRLEHIQSRSAEIFNVHPVHHRPVSHVSPKGLAQNIALEDPILDTVPTRNWFSLRRRVHTGPYPDYPTHLAPWHQDLSEAYAGFSLIDGLCPHQGTDLTAIPPDQNGVITCPLHGLQWCAQTGKIIVPDQTHPGTGTH